MFSPFLEVLETFLSTTFHQKVKRLVNNYYFYLWSFHLGLHVKVREDGKTYLVADSQEQADQELVEKLV